MKKLCFRCGSIKPLADFYKHSRMADGHLNKCKPCTLQDNQNYKLRNSDTIKANDRKRHNTPAHREAVRISYKARMATAEGKKNRAVSAKLWVERNRLKRTAHIIAQTAINSGRLKWQPCQNCKSEEGVQAHHEDYTLPLEVTWLCRSCHGQRHRELNETKRKSKQ